MSSAPTVQSQDVSIAQVLQSFYVVPNYQREYVWAQEQVEQLLSDILDELIGPNVTREWITDLPAYETTFDGDLVDAMNAALLAVDPEARIVPYMLSGGTDAKAFAKLGIRCFGFVPLRLPPDLNFGALFHGIDERVPLDGLQFGVRVLNRFLAAS